MIKKLSLILIALIASVFCILLIATTFKKPLIPNQYCEKIYSTVKQCVPGCIWIFNEKEFSGFVMDDKTTPFLPQGETACSGS